GVAVDHVRRVQAARDRGLELARRAHDDDARGRNGGPAPSLGMIWESDEVRETLRMIEAEHLDIRAVTMGISLRDCAGPDLDGTCGRIFDKILTLAQKLVPTVEAVQADFAVPITNKRISVTPIAMVAEASHARSFVPVAQTLDRAARELGIDYIGG